MANPSASLETEKVVLLESVARAAQALQIPWLLTGAGARVLLLEKLRGLPPGRATEDLDFGVMVKSWDDYRALRDRICKDGRLREDPKQAQRLLFGESAMLDLLPFGDIASPDSAVSWPSDEGVVMNVLGFQEALDSAVSVLVNGRLGVPVATAQAMLLLKLIVWDDRHVRSPGKDASDIAYMLHHGIGIIGSDAFYDQYSEATEAVDWDLDLAAARVFGLQMASLAQHRTKDHLLSILNRELAQGEDSLLVREVSANWPAGGKEPAKTLLVLQQALAGLTGEGTS